MSSRTFVLTRLAAVALMMAVLFSDLPGSTSMRVASGGLVCKVVSRIFFSNSGVSTRRERFLFFAAAAHPPHHARRPLAWRSPSDETVRSACDGICWTHPAKKAGSLHISS